MNTLSLKSFCILSLLFALSPRQTTKNAGRQSGKDGKIVVFVMWGDNSSTPANDVYIEAHGFVHKYKSEKSFVLTSSKAGRYEASLPPAIYDVFVSEGTSEPRCKRMRIQGGLTNTWTLKLKVDQVYTSN